MGFLAGINWVVADRRSSDAHGGNVRAFSERACLIHTVYPHLIFGAQDLMFALWK